MNSAVVRMGGRVNCPFWLLVEFVGAKKVLMVMIK